MSCSFGHGKIILYRTHVPVACRGGAELKRRKQSDTVKIKNDNEIGYVYRYRIYPTHEQEKAMFDTLNLCRELYNLALNQRQIAYKQFKTSVNYVKQQNELPVFKQAFSEFKNVQSQVLQDVLHRLDKAYINFFEKRAKYPRFKPRDRYVSFTYPQVQKSKPYIDGYIYLSKIGYVKVHTHRPFDWEKVKQITVKYESGEWYVSLVATVTIRNKSHTHSEMGIDVGIKRFVALSDGQTLASPKYLRKAEKRLKRLQRRLSRKKKGSNNRRKAKDLLAIQHKKVVNKRRDFLHKTSFRIVKHCKLIAVENLHVKNMVRNHKLAKSIADSSWSKFINMLEYKSALYGRRLIKVPAQGTSQTCICGHPVPKDLSIRVHHCDKCNITKDRDVMSAMVILQKAKKLIA